MVEGCIRSTPKQPRAIGVVLLYGADIYKDMKLKDIITEITGQPSNTFQMYRGGQRWTRIPTEIIGSKKGRYEAGIGIYTTNSYNTARRYAGGSRVVQLVTVDNNFKDLNKVDISVTELIDFVKKTSRMRNKNCIIDDIMNYSNRVKKSIIPLETLNNLIVNYEAGAGSVGVDVSNFFVSKGVDANIVQQYGQEFWLVVFNPKIIRAVSVVDPKKVDSDFEFVLPQIK
jgi:hypothetical protein